MQMSGGEMFAFFFSFFNKLYCFPKKFYFSNRASLLAARARTFHGALQSPSGATRLPNDIEQPSNSQQPKEVNSVYPNSDADSGGKQSA